MSSFLPARICLQTWMGTSRMKTFVHHIHPLSSKTVYKLLFLYQKHNNGLIDNLCHFHKDRLLCLESEEKYNCKVLQNMPNNIFSLFKHLILQCQYNMCRVSNDQERDGEMKSKKKQGSIG